MSDVPFSNTHFVAYLKAMVGQPYWYGCCGYKATSALLARKTKQCPDHYGSERTKRYLQDIAEKKVVCDCIGGAKGYAWSNGGTSMLEAIGTDKDVSKKYASHGCPDKNANGMFEYAKKKGCNWGTIDTLPEIPGLALTKPGHAGYYIGNGKCVEWQGFDYGCVITEVKKRPWVHWYELPFINYSTPSESGDATKKVVILGSVNVRTGNSIEYKKIGVARNNESFEWLATSENGWHQIKYKDSTGWVSGKYSKIV